MPTHTYVVLAKTYNFDEISHVTGVTHDYHEALSLVNKKCWGLGHWYEIEHWYAGELCCTYDSRSGETETDRSDVNECIGKDRDHVHAS